MLIAILHRPAHPESKPRLVAFFRQDDRHLKLHTSIVTTIVAIMAYIARRDLSEFTVEEFTSMADIHRLLHEAEATECRSDRSDAVPPPTL